MNTYFNSWLCKDLAFKLHLHKVCLHFLKCSNCNYFFLFQSPTVLLAFLADSFSLGGGRGFRGHPVNAKQWVSWKKKQCVSSFTPSHSNLWRWNHMVLQFKWHVFGFQKFTAWSLGFSRQILTFANCKWTGLYWNSPVSGSLSKGRNLCWYCYCECLFQSGGKNRALRLNFI